MRKIGYARVSPPIQNLDRQIAALRKEGCDVIFREKASGKDILNRPQLERAIDELGTGDILVVAEWDRATRSMLDGVGLIERIHKAGCAAPCARQASLGPNDTDRPRLHCILERFGGGRTAKDRQPCKRRQEGRKGPWSAVRSQAEARWSPTTGSAAPSSIGRERTVCGKDLPRSPRNSVEAANLQVNAAESH